MTAVPEATAHTTSAGASRGVGEHSRRLGMPAIFVSGSNPPRQNTSIDGAPVQTQQHESNNSKQATTLQLKLCLESNAHLKRENTSLRADLEAMKATPCLAVAETCIDVAPQHRGASDDHNAQVRDEIQSLQRALELSKSELQLSREDDIRKSEANHRLGAELKQVKAELELSAEHHVRLQKENTSLQSNLEVAQADVQRLSSVAAESEGQSEERERLRVELEKADEKLRVRGAYLVQLEEENTRLRGELHDSQSLSERLGREVEEGSKRCDDLSEEISNLQGEVKHLLEHRYSGLSSEENTEAAKVEVDHSNPQLEFRNIDALPPAVGKTLSSHIDAILNAIGSYKRDLTESEEKVVLATSELESEKNAHSAAEARLAESMSIIDYSNSPFDICFCSHREPGTREDSTFSGRERPC
ncbi:hypothetical protein BV22DRAFT_1050737 [Leucogyrophana mollusca]|uniref:Uncharacterized protein n=1 Tax=Leucogyrophana mollusca TaxID=85980 RepID=A0ACB8B2J5_9AGAM|nr:hypothetical protein BV22DRAFT_1050737 [Leucogyrophana mollusca]